MPVRIGVMSCMLVLCWYNVTPVCIGVMSCMLVLCWYNVTSACIGVIPSAIFLTPLQIILLGLCVDDDLMKTVCQYCHVACSPHCLSPPLVRHCLYWCHVMHACIVLA